MIRLRKTEQPTATEEVTNPFAEARMAPATLRANLALPLMHNTRRIILGLIRQLIGSHRQSKCVKPSRE